MQCLVAMQEDGDQSPLSLRDSTCQPYLQQQYDQNMHFPEYMQREPDRVLVGTLWSGSLPRLQSYFNPNHVHYRAFPTRIPIVALVVFVAQRRDIPHQEAIDEYMPILNFWLDKGARVDAKDVYGQTALHWAVGLNPMLPLAKILLQKGANVNMQTRSGTTALKNCVGAGEVCKRRLIHLSFCPSKSGLKLQVPLLYICRPATMDSQLGTFGKPGSTW